MERGHRSWALAVVATLGMSVSYVDRQTLAAIAPSVRSALHIDQKHYGLLIGSFSIAYLFGAPLAGVVVDRFGARRGFAMAVLVWSIVAGAHALATSFAMLFVLRILLGTAESPSFPSAAQAIRRALPGARRPLAYGLLFTGSSLGAVVAGKLAVKLDAAYGFQWAFVGTALVGTLWLPAWLIASRGMGLDAPAARTEEKKERVSWVSMATSAPVLRAMIAVLGSAPGIMFVMNWTSLFLVDHWHFKKEDVGNYLVIPPLVFDLGVICFGWLASERERRAHGDRDPERATELVVDGVVVPVHPDEGRRTHVDLMAIATVLAATLALAPLAPSPDIAIAIFAIAICGGGGVYVLVTADMLARVPMEKASSAGGMTAAAQSLTHVAGGYLIGAALDRTHSYTGVLVVLGLMIIPTSLVFTLWPGLRRG